MNLPSKKTVLVVVTAMIIVALGGVSYAAINSKKVSVTSPVKTSTKTATVHQPSAKLKVQQVTKTTAIETPAPKHPAPVDNSNKCIAIYNRAVTALDSLSTQINAKMKEMQDMLTNRKMSSDLGLTGYGTTGVLNNGAWQRDYNAIGDEINRLTDEYTTEKQNYVNQIAGLKTPNSPGCIDAFRNITASADE